MIILSEKASGLTDKTQAPLSSVQSDHQRNLAQKLLDKGPSEGSDSIRLLLWIRD